MSGQIAHAMEDAARKAEQGLAQDFSKAYHSILKDTEEKTTQVAEHAAENEAKTVEDLGKSAEHATTEPHEPHPDGGGPGPRRASENDENLPGDGRRQVVLTGVRMPRMNSIMERWVQTCRHEVLDRTLIWNESHLRRALREFEQHHNAQRPHQAMNQAAPLRAVPEPLEQERITRLDIRRRPTRRRHPRVPTCCLNCADEVVGRRSDLGG
ncbi:integrase core domain-containing protein [Streptacidiphilus anmyonensis]|uniref:integrase core domain-containing protein n=1 Tax=Streptacidiphilus anmyonensis TaxID=405782 RepID=UPI001364D6E9|nr:integrase core domain-containing protein [Streptacidiphilus anmyonensis]